MCDLVLYKNGTGGSAGEAVTATLYAKCYSWFLFDLDLEVFQSTASITYDGTYITTTPSGTLVAQASTSTKRLELVNGELYIAGTKVSKDGHTHTTSLASDTGNSTVSLTHGGKYKLTAGGNSVIFTMPSDADTKVTSVDNHYTPTATDASELTATISGTAETYAEDTEYTVLTGVKAQRDAKGHITGLTYTAQKVKDTNTNS